jgi:hypothetical protein
MSLTEYFDNAEGTGILATADGDGNVDLAVYGKPHMMDEETTAFIMSDRLSHKNVTSNPNAAYMFMEKGSGYKGKRLYLTMTREETDKDVIDSVRRRGGKHHPRSDEKKYLVYFRINHVRPLVGDAQ